MGGRGVQAGQEHGGNACEQSANGVYSGMSIEPAISDARAYLAKLNPRQREAVLHGDGAVAGPLLIVAGAGTGKTNTLVHRLAHLVVAGADPRRILVMTFSRRAAAELTRRAGHVAAEVLGPKASVLAEGLSWAGTFHAIGARVLRELGPAIGLDPGFTIHDRADSADLMNMIRHRRGLSQTEKRFPAKATCLAIYSRAVNAREPLGEVLTRHFPWCAEWEEALAGLFEDYVAAKQEQGVLDYDDLLLYWAAALDEAAIAAELGGRFDHVLVDEYQDTNRLQAEILMRLKPDGRGVAAVGDDAQSIYAFRAAEVRNILDFPAAFDPPARVVTLEENYRSSPQILAAANAVIAEAAERHAKTLTSRRPEGPPPALVTVAGESAQVDHVCAGVLEARETGCALKEQAVLFRTGHHSGALEVELTRRNIPFVKYGGLKFLDSAHVKDLLAVLRFAENPADRVAGFRVLQLVEGVGPGTAGKVLDALAEAAEPVAALAAAPVPKRAAAGWAGFAALIADLRAGRAGWPAEVEAVRRWLEPVLERRHDDHAARAADLVQLEQIARGYADRGRFLSEITLDPPDASSDIAGAPHLDEDYLILSTIHSAKGQEWRRVYILNCVDGCIPSEMSTGSREEIEEERRLLYVAMTRAREHLSLIQPQRFYTHGQHRRGDRHVYALPSRFLTPPVVARCEAVTWPPPEARPGTGPARPQAPVDLKAKMRGMWR